MLFAILVLNAFTVAGMQGDADFPQLVSFNIAPRSVDVRDGIKRVTFTVEATDLGTGIAKIEYFVVDPTGRQRGRNSTVPNSGDAFSGGLPPWNRSKINAKLCLAGMEGRYG